MRRYTNHKDLNSLIRKLVRDGWVFERGKKHGRLYCKHGGAFITIPCTPSARRVLTIVSAEVARIHE
jgi:hypothetical protein